MAFKCGHCKERHDTVAEARECAAKRQKFKSKYDELRVPESKFLEAALNEEQVYTLTPATQKYLSDLLNHFNLMLVDDQTVETINYRVGKKILNGLIDARRLQATSKPYTLPYSDGVMQDPTASNRSGERGPTPQQLPDCPPGYYAVADWTGKEELKFFRVKLVSKGQYKGYTFVDQVIGGHPNQTAKGEFAVKAIKSILYMGVEESGLLYAIKIKQCYNCNRSLTKKASRQLGLGRHCAFKKGQGEEWDALNYDYNDADAED